MAPWNSLVLHPQVFFLCSLSSPQCDSLAAFTIVVKKPSGLLCREVACRPVALGCDIHQTLTSGISLKPLHQKTCTFPGLSCSRCWRCCTCCYCLSQKMEVMAKADGSHGHPEGDVAAASCEIPSSLDEKLLLGVWLPCFQTGFFFLAVPL